MNRGFTVLCGDAYVDMYMQLFCMYTHMNVIMLGGVLVYCALLFSFDFYLMGSSIYVYMSDLVRRWIAISLIVVL
jgi:hypothetical protein